MYLVEVKFVNKSSVVGAVVEGAVQRLEQAAVCVLLFHTDGSHLATGISVKKKIQISGIEIISIHVGLQ